MNIIFRIYILIIFFSLNFSLKSQQNNILYDEFDNNFNNWTIISNSSHLFEINNGVYSIEGKQEGRAITTTITVDTNVLNFKISAEFTKLSGIDNNGFGLIWGGQDENNEFEFIISGNGQFKIIEWNNAKQNDIVSWSNSSTINKWNLSTNVLSIKSENNLWKFFINGNYVARCKKQTFFGNKFGFIVNEKIKYQVNYLKISSTELVNEIKSLNNDSNKITYNKNSMINPKILDVSFTGIRGKNNIYYGENAILKLTIKNLNSFDLKDIGLKIEPISSVDGLLFDDFVIIDKIDGYDEKQISILIKANDEIETADRKLMLKLFSIDNELLALYKIGFNSVGFGIYKEKTGNTSITSKNNNLKKTQNKNSAGCIKGCSITSLVILVLALIIEIL